MRGNNMASLIGGAALGPPFQMLFDVVVKIPLEKALLFKTMLNKIKSTVTIMEPLIKELTVSNMALDRPQSEMEGFVILLKEGKELVDKCSRFSKWRYIHKRPGYTTKLQKLDESLMHLLGILIPLQTARNQVETLGLVRDLHAKSNGKTEKTNYLADKTQNEIKSSCQAPEPPAFTVGLNKPLGELKNKLLSNDKKTVPIVITAPPGCGKTTLAEKICKDDKIKEKFKSNILFVRVSKNPNLNLIVEELYQHKGYSMSIFQENKDARSNLELFLKDIGKEPILLVLDDVWSGSESLIETFVFEIPDLEYKILVTSRFPSPRFEHQYELKALCDEDAMSIFRHYASLEDGKLEIPDDLVKKVVDHCKSVPLALKLIGSSLRGQHLRIWQREQEKWSAGSSILSYESELLSCLQSILDVLDEKHLKECFMDLGLFPEDRRIPVTALIDIWKELEGVKEDDSIINLIELSNRNLANIVVTRKDANELDDYYSEHFVTQHDMLRELAIHQSRQGSEEHRKRLIVELTENNLPKWWNEQKEQPFNASLLSISTGCSLSPTLSKK